MTPSPLVVGFDLDMTLIDSRPGIIETTRAISDEQDLDLDAEGVLDSLLTSTIDVEFKRWFGNERGNELADRFRELYVVHGVPGCDLLPGAGEAVATVRSAGGRAIVVTAKFGPNAQRCLDHVGLGVDAVFGRLHGAGKSEPLRAEGASVYVGDSLADVEAARVAGATSVMVPTGPVNGAELTDAGADVVLPDLTHFPEWLAQHYP